MIFNNYAVLGTYLNLSSSDEIKFVKVNGRPPVATWKGSDKGKFFTQ